jgi:palmitoyltransferase
MKYRFCFKCDKFKPDRTHHCLICNKCILKMDHHCPFLGICIGYYNYKVFINFIICLDSLMFQVNFIQIPELFK